jgi:PKD repeat protein
MSFLFRTSLLLVFLFAANEVLFSQSAQQSRTVSAVQHAQSGPVIIPDFTANITSGQAPLTVQFTDKSTITDATLVSRKWFFGNGDSIVDQNPATYTFQKDGIYSIELRLYTKDANHNTYNAGVIKTEYIVVGTGCDSLHYAAKGTPYYYGLGQGKGYVSGNNHLGIKAVADYFAPGANKLQIWGTLLGWAKVAKLNTVNEKLYVKVWQPDGNGAPGKILDSTAIDMLTIDTNFVRRKYTKAKFAVPLEVSGGFFIGITLPEQTGDTVVLYTSGNGVVPTNTGWFQLTDKTWKSYPDYYSNITSLTNYIFPLTCQSIKISVGEIAAREEPFAVWPNPADYWLNISPSGTTGLHTAEYSLIDLTGREISKGKIGNAEVAQIDVSFLKSGIYILRITSSFGTVSRKVVKR